MHVIGIYISRLRYNLKANIARLDLIRIFTVCLQNAQLRLPPESPGNGKGRVHLVMIGKSIRLNVNSEIFTRVLFSRSFVKTKSSRNGEITLTFTDKCKPCHSRDFYVANMSFITIREKKILAKISEFTVNGFVMLSLDFKKSVFEIGLLLVSVTLSGIRYLGFFFIRQ